MFVASVKGTGNEAICGLRMHQDCAHIEKYAALFLELGGDLVSLETDGEHSAFFERCNGGCIETLTQQTPAAEIYERLKRCRLLALPLNFQDQKKQVTSFF